MRPSFKRNSRERGSVALIASVSMLVLLGFTGMAIDVGYLQWDRVRIQDAADAAAMAALITAENGGTSSAITTAGTNNAQLNGFTSGSNGVTVTINTPPTLGTLAGQSNAVEAIVTQTVPTFFMALFNLSSVSVKGYASGAYPTSTSGTGFDEGVASGSQGGSGTGSSSGCVYVLDTAPGDADVFQVDGSPGTTFNCGVIVESPNAAAVELEGAETVTIGTGYTLGVVGPSTCTAAQPATQTGCGIDYTSNQDYICSTGSTGCSASAEPTANGIASPGDPLSNVSMPTASSATMQYKNYWDMNSQPANNSISPGVYCGGFTIGNNNGATYTLQAGTYFVAGGTLSFQSQANITGSGVTFILTSPSLLTANYGATCPATSQYTGQGTTSISPTSTTMAKVQITGQPNVTLSAPASGASSGVVGMLFFEDRNSTTDNTPSINGNSTTSLNGAIYFKNSSLTFTGVNGSNTGYMMIVVKKLIVNGSSPIVVYNVNNPLKSTTVMSGTAPVLTQ
jgi:hypothetical protein